MMSAEQAPEQRCLENQGQLLLQTSLLISLYALYPKLPSSDIELLHTELLSATSIEYVIATTTLKEVLQRHAQLSATAYLPSLVVHAVRRATFDIVHSCLLEAFIERASALYDALATLRARAAIASPPRVANMSSPSPPLSPETEVGKADPAFISMLTEWAVRDPPRRSISWSDRASGPSHLRTFEVTCKLNEEVIGTGKGQQKKAAKAQCVDLIDIPASISPESPLHSAAHNACRHLGLVDDPLSNLLASVAMEG